VGAGAWDLVRGAVREVGGGADDGGAVHVGDERRALPLRRLRPPPAPATTSRAAPVSTIRQHRPEPSACDYGH
jgi:hypothetical protein